MLDELIIQIATVAEVAAYLPGTGLWGGVFGLGFYLFLNRLKRGKGFLLASSILFAVVVTDIASSLIGVKDSSLIILDEFVAIPLVFLGFKYKKGIQGFSYLILGLGIFALLDKLKPLGLSVLESLPGGVGIVADDIGAAFLAMIVLNIIFRLPNLLENKSTKNLL